MIVFVMVIPARNRRVIEVEHVGVVWHDAIDLEAGRTHAGGQTTGSQNRSGMADETSPSASKPGDIPAYKTVIPKKLLQRAAAVLISGTVVGSFLPGEIKWLLGTEPYDPDIGHPLLGHRIYHFATFGLSALTLLLLSRNLRGELRAAIAVAVLGCVIEVTQHLIGFSRVLEWWDIRDDSFAVIAMFLLVQGLNIRARIHSAKNSGYRYPG